MLLLLTFTNEGNEQRGCVLEQLGQGLASLRKIKLWIQVEDKTRIK